MIKFKSGEVLGLALSHENLDLLRQGAPFAFPISDVRGLDGVSAILIFAGETEREILDNLSKPFLRGLSKKRTKPGKIRVFQKKENSET